MSLRGVLLASLLIFGNWTRAIFLAYFSTGSREEPIKTQPQVRLFSDKSWMERNIFLQLVVDVIWRLLQAAKKRTKRKNGLKKLSHRMPVQKSLRTSTKACIIWSQARNTRSSKFSGQRRSISGQQSSRYGFFLCGTSSRLSWRHPRDWRLSGLER